MSDTTHTGPMLAADGSPLKRSLERALRRQKLRALALIAPLLIFILVTFIAPIADMLFRSVENEIVSETLPRTVVALKDWDPTLGELPDEAVFAAMAADLQEAAKAKIHTRVGSRLNYETPGISSLFRKSGRQASKWDLEKDGPFKDVLIKSEKGWGELDVWKTIQVYSPKYTNGYFLNAVDLEKTASGISPRDEDQQIYITLFLRTFAMSIGITLSCLMLGYPVA